MNVPDSHFMLILFPLCLGFLSLSLSSPSGFEKVQWDLLTDDPSLKLLESEAGLVGVNATSDLFYWYFAATNASSSSSTPVFLWLQGGPGAPSMAGLLTEMGPVEVDLPSLKLKRRDLHWCEKAHCVFLDQPVGTGFSGALHDSDYSRNSFDHAATNIHTFLTKFMAAHPHLHSLPFFVLGESYGGTYVPSIGNFLLEHPIAGLDFRGVAIGNGMTDTPLQAGADLQVAHAFGVLDMYQLRPFLTADGSLKADGLNGEAARKLTEKVLSMELDSDGEVNSQGEEEVEMLQEMWRKDSHFFTDFLMAADGGGVSPFNANQGMGGMLLDFQVLAGFFSKEETKKALNVPCDREFEVVNPKVMYFISSEDFQAHHRHVFRDFVGKLLNAKKAVLLYQGNLDLKLGPLSNEKWVDSLDMWPSIQGFRAAERSPWPSVCSESNKADEKGVGSLGCRPTMLSPPFGFLRTFENLGMATVLGAGHMVPSDKPRPAKTLIESFLLGDLVSYGNWSPVEPEEDAEKLLV